MPGNTCFICIKIEFSEQNNTNGLVFCYITGSRPLHIHIHAARWYTRVSTLLLKAGKTQVIIAICPVQTIQSQEYDSPALLTFSKYTITHVSTPPQQQNRD